MWPWAKIDPVSVYSASLRSSHLGVLATLATYCNEAGIVSVPHAVVGKLCRLSRRSVVRIVSELVEAGFLERIGITRESGLCVYRIRAGAAAGKLELVRHPSACKQDFPPPDPQPLLDSLPDASEIPADPPWEEATSDGE